jgi:hypothetical protein
VFPGATLTVGFDIKNSGAIIEEYGYCVGPLADNPFPFSHGTFTTLPKVPGADATNAAGIDSRGNIVGTYITGEFRRKGVCKGNFAATKSGRASRLVGV